VPNSTDEYPEDAAVVSPVIPWIKSFFKLVILILKKKNNNNENVYHVVLKFEISSISFFLRMSDTKQKKPIFKIHSH
jgi:hypothetical protein